MKSKTHTNDSQNSKPLVNDDATARRLRTTILKMIHAGKSGHPGGSFSCLDIIMTLFADVLNFNPENPEWEKRDRFILSKGHGVPALYAVLSECGYFPSDWLMTLRHFGSPLQGHPDRARMFVMEAATGSLGQGLSIAQGMAMAGKMDKSDHRVFCLIGDGETQEGQVWEAAMSAPKFQLDNLTVITDYNHGQIDGRTEEVMNLNPLIDKWRAFNWNVLEVDGHDREALKKILPQKTKEKPTMVIAHTVKGKGVSFMEGVIDWHGVAPNDEQLAKAIKELA
ncbi:MAG: Transketolase [Bacteriovoracaceae bacterium]|nr:Transketolase [Bacteriovoracaceae bacterium]